MANDYPKVSSEYLIQVELTKLINKVAEQLYTDDFKRSSAYGTPENQLDTLGIIVSKFCKWDGDAIADVAQSAFEDANFSNVEITY